MTATLAEVGARLRRTRHRERGRVRLVAAALVGLLAVLTMLALLVGGSTDIPLPDIVPAAFGQGSGLADYVVFRTRVPRALTALLAGALFGLAGHLYQRLVGNILATPDILGVSAGASAGAATVLTLGVVGLGVQVSAVVGAVGVGVAVFLLSWRRGVSPYRLVLVGIGIGACASAYTTYLVTRADEMSVERALRWMIGSLAGADWSGVGVLAVTLVLGLAGLHLLAEDLRTFALGDDAAGGLGTRVARVRFAALVAGAMLAAVATSITGPIGFVALVAGPLAARLARRADVPIIAALVGGALVAASDIIAQTAPFISPVPTGSITAVVGAPALVYLLVRSRRRP